jgi:hypothetical protein
MGGVVSPRIVVIGDDVADDEAHEPEQFHADSSVSPDGRELDIEVIRDDQFVQALRLSFGEACSLYHELRVALQMAKGRQKMTLRLADAGRDGGPPANGA